MNDSLRSDIFVRHSPETIACACIFLAARLLQVPLPTNPSWYEAFRISEAKIEDAAFRIFSLYARPKVNTIYAIFLLFLCRFRQISNIRAENAWSPCIPQTLFFPLSPLQVDVDRVDKIVKDLRAKQQEEKKVSVLSL